MKVAVLGGGVAGMSAAHELAERGFLVDVFERQPTYVGSKARSVDVPADRLIKLLPVPPTGPATAAPAPGPTPLLYYIILALLFSRLLHASPDSW